MRKMIEKKLKNELENRSNVNYTKPNDKTHKDESKDWLNSSLIFARTISLLLDDNSGVVIELKGDMFNPTNKESGKVVVFKKDNMIHIDNLQDNSLIEGDLIKII
jgi:hypothetical protein